MTDSEHEAIVRVQAMPKDTNPTGDIFGGWVLSHMDIAGAQLAESRADGTVVTAAVDSMEFKRPVNVGDMLACYGEVIDRGTTSLTIRVTAKAIRHTTQKEEVVTKGEFVYVAVDEDKNPRPLPGSEGEV